MPKITPFLWFDNQAEDAAKLYVSLFPNSKINHIARYPSDGQDGGETGKVMIVQFELDGQKVTAMNAGPTFKLSEAFSFVIDCDGQDEVDHYWNALTANGGQESQCGWLKDPYGLSWQVTPKQLIEATTSTDREAAGRAFQAMMTMKKIDVAAIQKAFRGE